MVGVRIVLGSSSPYRRVLLSELVAKVKEWSFDSTRDVLNPDIDERAVTVPFFENCRNESPPDQLSLAIAQAKMDALLNRNLTNDYYANCNERVVVIASDQVAYLKGEIREKPNNEEQCRLWMKQYIENPIQVCTAVIVARIDDKGECISRLHGTQIASVQFTNELTDIVLDQLIQCEKEIMKCCGGFIISSPTVKHALGQQSGTSDEIMGFPKKLVHSLINHILIE